MSMVKRRGPWSSSEDHRLVAFIHEDPTLNWVNISTQVESRTPKQCRERYHQNLKKSLNHAPITSDEGVQINAFVSKHGKRWADIARQLNGRSDNAVKNWWNGNQNRLRRAEQRRRAAADQTDAGTGSVLSSPVSTHAHTQPGQQLSYDHPTTHQRNGSGSMQDLIEAAALHRRDHYRPPPPPQPYAASPQTYAGAYGAHGQEPFARERVQSPFYQQDHLHAREPQFAHYAPAQNAPAQNAPAQNAPAHHAPAQQYQTQYAQPPSYQYQSGPPSAGLDSLYHQARRPSVYADSPGADSVDHGSAPSLVSDHGSPSVRGSSSHAWPSPTLTLELPPLLNINGSVSKSNTQHAANSSPSTQYALPSFDRPSFDRSSFERPSFERPSYERSSYERSSYERSSYERPSHERPSYERSSYERSSYERPSHERPSYERSSFERPAPRGSEPSGSEPASASSVSYSAPASAQSDEGSARQQSERRQLTASAEEAVQAAEVIMSLPKGDGKRGGFGVSDLLN